jgi:hypothetical protein
LWHSSENLNFANYKVFENPVLFTTFTYYIARDGVSAAAGAAGGKLTGTDYPLFDSVNHKARYIRGECLYNGPNFLS